MKKTIAKLLCLSLILLCLSCHKKSTKIASNRQDKVIQPTIVLCHGLAMTPDSLTPLKKHLQQAFPKATLLVPHQENSNQISIKKQGQEVADYILDNYTKEVPIVLIGHSQGGIRAYCAAQALVKKNIKVACVISIGTPWEGAPILDSTESKLGAVCDQLDPALKSKFHEKEKGVVNMQPQSDFLKKLHKTLKNNSVPMLAIGGDAESHVPSKVNKEILENAIGSTEHDMLIPLENQLASNLHVDNLERYTVNGTVHFTNSRYGKTREVANSDVLDKVQAYIGEKLGITPISG